MAEMRRGRALALAALAACVLAAAPEAWGDGQQAPMSQAELQKAKGVIQEMALGDGVNLELRKGYAFLPAAEVSPILRKLNVPPPSAQVLGAVTAQDANPASKTYWISVITEDPIGHVPETGQGEIASMSFLDTVKAARAPSPALVAFAVTPAYAQNAKTLIWAEKYDSKPPTPNLRHEERLLGRDEIAGVTTIAPATALRRIDKSAREVLAMLSFTPGKTYADYVAGADRLSEYDLPGVITGKRKAGPLADTAGATAPPAAAAPLTLADFAPGGKLQWVPWLGGGIVVLIGGYFAVSALRRRPGSLGDPNITPQNGDGNAG